MKQLRALNYRQDDGTYRYAIKLCPTYGKTTLSTTEQSFIKGAEFRVVWSQYRPLAKGERITHHDLRRHMDVSDVEFDVIFDAFDNALDEMRADADSGVDYVAAKALELLEKLEAENITLGDHIANRMMGGE